MKDIETVLGAHKQPGEVKRLILDFACKAQQLSPGLRAFTQLEELSCIGLGLTSLESFPSLSHLTRLNLSDNKIPGSHIQHLVNANLPRLTRLDLANNRIHKLDDLRVLSSLPCLQRLDVLDCPVASAPDFHAKVFAMLPELQYLDNTDRKGNEHDGEEDDEVDEDEAGGVEEAGEGGGEEVEFDEDEEDDEEEEGAPKPYGVLVGDEPLADDDDDDEYEDEGEGPADEPDEDEEEGEEVDDGGEEEAAPGGIKRKREGEGEGEE